jgi:hypothetical protein
MAFDINNQYTGKFYGQDRIGHTTPDLEVSDVLRPWLPVAYPAPYLPGLRQDQGHPKLANIVLSSQHLVGLDKSGALVPAGLFCGSQTRQSKFSISNVALTSNVVTVTTSATHNYVSGDTVTVTAVTNTAINGTFVITVASSTTFTYALTHGNISSGSDTGTTVLVTTSTGLPAGQFCVLVYGPNDVGFAWNASTGAYVATAGEHAVLACPSDAVAATITQADGSTVVVSSGDVTFALACNLFDTGVARPIGVATRNVYQYIGGVVVSSTTGGMLYRLDGNVPINFIINNYMHEMGTAIQTQYVIRLPWVGTSRYALTADATSASITGYSQGYGLTFAHFTGTPLKGQGVVASNFGQDYGNYTTYVAATNAPTDVIGRVIGVMNMINKIGFSNRVRTLWDPSRLVGPVADPNPASLQMGGSATGGIDYTLNLTTDGIYKKALTQGKAALPEYGTYVIVRVNL